MAAIGGLISCRRKKFVERLTQRTVRPAGEDRGPPGRRLTAGPPATPRSSIPPRATTARHRRGLVRRRRAKNSKDNDRWSNSPRIFEAGQ